MAMTKDYLDQAIEPEVEASPFDRLASAVDRLRELQKHSEAIADRIAGQVPQDAGTKPELNAIAGGGLIDGLERQIGFINQLSKRISASLSRIESRL